jgi:hypothetical protein
MMPRPAAAATAAAAALTCALAVAACSGGGSTGTAAPSASARPSRSAMSPPQVLAAAASQAQQVRSFSATMTINSSGVYTSSLSGTVDEQVKPTLLAHEKYSVTANGTPLPGGMEAVLTGQAIYLKLSSLSQMLGKPWVKVSFASLKSGTGANFAPLVHQMQTSNPLAYAQMLPDATSVQAAGTATIGGVATTEYTGTLDPVKALTRLDPSLEKVLAPMYQSLGITSDKFTVWVDGQHQIRKLSQVQSGPKYHATSVMTVTSVNQPVTVQVPPASQTAGMPGV